MNRNDKMYKQRRAITDALAVFDDIENRCMDTDGPVKPMKDVVTEDELRLVQMTLKRARNL